MPLLSYKITVTGQLDGAGVLPAQPKPLAQVGRLIEIAAVGPIGIIDPDFNGAESIQAYFLSYIRISLGAAAGGAGTIDVVDENGAVVINIPGLAGNQLFFTDAGVYFPPGCRLLIDDNVANAGPHEIWLNFWPIDSTKAGILASASVA